VSLPFNHLALHAELLRAERVVSPSGEVRWMLSDVIGSEDGLGVECLSGSGAIASAYNRAFR
jgi:acetyl-CoA carboxylase/biotin carboxylase 1